MDADVFDEIQRLRQQGRKGALATIVQVRGSIPSFQSAKMLVRDDGSIVGSIGGGCVEAEVWSAAQEVIREEKSRVMSFDLTDDSMADSGLIAAEMAVAKAATSVAASNASTGMTSDRKPVRAVSRAARSTATPT